jgi:hypothetical protein
MSIQTSLALLASYSEDLSAAIQLMRFAGQFMPPKGPPPAPYRQWYWFAARMGAITINAAGEQTDYFFEMLERSAVTAGFVDLQGLRAAKDFFDTAFPGIKDLRHSAAHNIYGSDDRVEKHRPLDTAAVFGGLHGTRYTTHFQGKELAYDLSEPTLDAFDNFVKRVFAAFSGLCV